MSNSDIVLTGTLPDWIARGLVSIFGDSLNGRVGRWAPDWIPRFLYLRQTSDNNFVSYSLKKERPASCARCDGRAIFAALLAFPVICLPALSCVLDVLAG